MGLGELGLGEMGRHRQGEDTVKVYLEDVKVYLLAVMIVVVMVKVPLRTLCTVPMYFTCNLT